MQEVSRNTFEGGMNGDISIRLQQPNTYRNALNVTSSISGSIYELSDIEGSELYTKLIDTFLVEPTPSFDIKIGKGFKCVYKNLSYEDVDGYVLLYCVNYNGVFKFYITLVNGVEVNHIHIKNVDVDYYTSFMIEARILYEGVENMLYFIDGVNMIKRVPLVLNGTGYTDSEMSFTGSALSSPYVLTRLRLDDRLSTSSASYQFFYRLVRRAKVNPSSTLYSSNIIRSKWSLISHPFNIFGGLIKEGVGIDVTIFYNNEEAEFYTHYELCIVKNTDFQESMIAYSIGEKNIIKEQNQITYIFSNDTPISYEINLSDVVVEDAPIKTANTFNIIDNRIVLGGVTYNTLEYDNGNPIIDGANSSILSYQKDVRGTDGIELTNNKRTFFKDEVYRFAISYHDSNMNWSIPKTLDLSQIPDNAIEAGLIDIKFPKSFTDYNDINNYIFNELNINGITNHPSWAKGFVILMAKRKKNILFQSPLIPACGIDVPLALGDYPKEGDELGNTKGTMFPKNLTFPFVKDIVRNEGGLMQATYNATDAATPFLKQYNAVCYGVQRNQNVNFVYPPEYLYGLDSKKEAFVKPYSIDIQDIIAFKQETYVYNKTDNDNSDIQIPSVVTSMINGLPSQTGNYFDRFGDSKDAKCFLSIKELFRFNNYYSGINLEDFFDSLKNPSYYINGNTNEDKFTYNKSSKVIDYANIVAGGKAYFIDSNNKSKASVFDIEGLVGSLNKQNTVISPNCFVISTEGGMADLNYEFFESDYKFILHNKPEGDGTSSKGIKEVFVNPNYIPDINTYFVNFTNSNGGAADLFFNRLNAYHKFTPTIPIVNAYSGLKDNRYGLSDDYNEFIFTGTYSPISKNDIDSNSPINVVVSNGDCFVSRHTLRINNNHYSLSNAINDIDKPTNERKWGEFLGYSFFLGANDHAIERPVANISNIQEVTVTLESEFHGSAFYGKSFKTSPIRDYDYIKGIGVLGSQKLWVSVKQDATPISYFPANLAYSDVNITQSSTDGFARFRANNIFQLNQEKGAITAIRRIRDNIIVFQEEATNSITVNSRLLTTNDGGLLAVGSGDFIGNNIVISNTVGCSDINGIIVYEDVLFFYSRNSKGLYAISNGIKDITDGAGYLIRNNDFSSVYATYNNRYKEVLFFFGNLGLSYSIRGAYISEHYYGDNLAIKGLISDTNSYLVVYTDLSINKVNIDIFNRNSGKILGYDKKSFVSLILNQNNGIPKIYDSLSIVSTNKLKDVRLFVSSEDNQQQPNDSGIVSIEDIDARESTYRINEFRDIATESRIRGNAATCEINWKEGSSEKVSISSLFCKYRKSVKSI